METQLVFNSDTFIALAMMLFLGSVMGVLITRLIEWFRTPYIGREAGMYRCQKCRWVYHYSHNGRWSSALFDEANVAFVGSRLDEYSDSDLRDLYGDCYDQLVKIGGMEWESTEKKTFRAV